MIIRMTLPLKGTWYTKDQCGDKEDSIKPLPFPFDLSYRNTLVSLDVGTGSGVYDVEVEDSTITPEVLLSLKAFGSLPVEAKRQEVLISGKALPTDILKIGRSNSDA